jgi:organic radical activating enzyme
LNTFRKIAFGYSNHCNIKCAHCVAADEANPKAKMDLTKARALVAEMATADVKGISFTAGEPLLYLNDLIALIRLCKKYGIYSRVVTNGFWAKTRPQANDIVSALMAAGLSQLRISFSRWHQAHVSRENIVTAAASCQKLGLDYFVSFVTDLSETDAPYEQFLQDNHLKYFPEPLIYFGRAQKLNRPEVFGDYPSNQCAMNPYLEPTLDMFACCDAGSRFTETGFLHLGNLSNHSVATLYGKYETNPLYYLIKTVGLTPLASSLGMKTGEIVTYRKCELCEELFNSTKNLDRLKQLLNKEPTRWHR